MLFGGGSSLGGPVQKSRPTHEQGTVAALADYIDTMTHTARQLGQVSDLADIETEELAL
jgi:hypothetical protein